MRADEGIKATGIVRFTGAVSAVRTGAAQIVGAPGNYHFCAGRTPQGLYDRGHFLIKVTAVTVSAVILYAQQMMRAQMQTRVRSGRSSRRGRSGSGRCFHYTAGSPAYMVLRIAASTGRAMMITAAILMKFPGMKGITQAAREASRVMPVTTMNHAVPMT